MSLLLDALKRAEQVKGAAQVGAFPIGPDEPATPSESTSGKPAQGLSLETIDEPPARASIPSPEVADRDAVRKVFAAKHTSTRDAPPKPVWLLPLIAVTVVIVGGSLWYAWKEVNKGNSADPLIATGMRPRPMLTATPTAPQNPPAAADASANTLASQTPPLLHPAQSTVIPIPDRISGSRPVLSATDRAREDLAKSLKIAAKEAEQPPLMLRLTTGIDPPKVSEALAIAYTALRNGNTVEAKRLYSGLVAADGSNLDARLGLATAFARSNETNAAIREYRKALALDPRNSTALAGMLMLSDSSSIPGLEAEIRTLLTRFPDSPALSFALGNLLAGQARWTEAQQAYFDAWRQESDNADHAYNLAVSLDQLKQARLALDYYQKALSLAGRHGAQFDRKQVERRIDELKSVQAQ